MIRIADLYLNTNPHTKKVMHHFDEMGYHLDFFWMYVYVHCSNKDIHDVTEYLLQHGIFSEVVGENDKEKLIKKYC